MDKPNTEPTDGGIRNALEIHSRQINHVTAQLARIDAAKAKAEEFIAFIATYEINLNELRTRLEDVGADLKKLQADTDVVHPTPDESD